MNTPTFSQLKKTFVESGYEIRFFPRHRLEHLSLDAPAEVKRHVHSDIMGLIMPDQNVIGLATDLTREEKAATLLHELIHMYDPNLDEEEVEDLTLEMENNLSGEQMGFLQFLIS
jgi:hypothetical protein